MARTIHEMSADNQCATLYGNAQCSLSSLMPILQEYLTIEEETQILQQFKSKWRPNSQVLWSGILRKKAQRWAEEHDMQTLTTAMGPLMVNGNPLCFKKKKRKSEWSLYIKGASAVFAWCILEGEKVTVLSPPPPERFHPSGLTNYQAIEEPILKWDKMSHAVLQIEMVHPTVKGAENFRYQIWPVDKTATWISVFGAAALEKQRWREVTSSPWQTVIRRGIETTGGLVFGHTTSQGSGSGLSFEILGTEDKVSRRYFQKTFTKLQYYDVGITGCTPAI